MKSNSLSPVRTALSDVNLFADHVLKIPLLDYQKPLAAAISNAVLIKNHGIITVEMPRQSGKNQIAATCESFLLIRHYLSGGSIIKTAPTFQPQLTVSKNRLQSLLDH